MIKALVIGGVASGVGKTTVTLGLLTAFRRRGLQVRAFKVGPDFIDPGFHQEATGAPCLNLDSWMLSWEYLRQRFASHGAHADLVLVEGVMGLFDGAEGGAGSTAELAKAFGIPVILVVDGSALARSAGAVVLGFERFDPELEVAGVLFNRVAGEGHYRYLASGLQGVCRAVPLGFLPRREELHIPERHLGLLTVVERRLTPTFLEELVELVESHVELDRLLSLAQSRVPPGHPTLPFTRLPRARIGVALDEAFQFYYPDNLELLRHAGAELHFFSPVRDRRLPEVEGLYLGGGYPEVYAKALAANESMRADVLAFAKAGHPIYAECGGLMYLAEAIEDLEGGLHPMVGLFPTTIRMVPKRLALAYVEVELLEETILGKPGTVLRGHEFHYSHMADTPPTLRRTYCVRSPGMPTTRLSSSQAERTEGYTMNNVLASYLHLHFGSNPEAAESFVAACARWR